VWYQPPASNTVHLYITAACDKGLFNFHMYTVQQAHLTAPAKHLRHSSFLNNTSHRTSQHRAANAQLLTTIHQSAYTPQCSDYMAMHTTPQFSIHTVRCTRIQQSHPWWSSIYKTEHDLPACNESYTQCTCTSIASEHTGGHCTGTCYGNA
jgi:hypothetical protein